MCPLSMAVFSGAEYSTIEELVAMLKNGTVDAILLDMYIPVRRLDLFNGTWFEITQIVEKEISHGIVLNGAGAMALVKDLQEMIRDKNVQTNFLTHKDEEDEEHEHIEAHEVRALNPASRGPVSRAKNASYWMNIMFNKRLEVSPCSPI